MVATTRSSAKSIRLRSRYLKTQVPAPDASVAVVQKRKTVEVEEEEEEEEIEEYRGRTIRKWKDEFYLVATRRSPVKSSPVEAGVVQSMNRGGLIGKRLIKGLKGVKRTSPRLIKNMFG